MSAGDKRARPDESELGRLEKLQRLAQEVDALRRVGGDAQTSQALAPVPPNYAPANVYEEEEDERPFVCPERFCGKTYTSSAGLYQHKRIHHPWLIQARGTPSYDPEDLRFVCPEPNCDKAYATSMGIYQHKRAKHPWLINQRERGYTRCVLAD